MLSNELPDAFSVHKVLLSPSGSAEVAFVAPALTRTALEQAGTRPARAASESSQERRPDIQTRIFGRKRETTVYLSRAGFVALLEALSSAEVTKLSSTHRISRDLCAHRSRPGAGRHVRRYIPAYAYELARGDKAFAAYINLGEGRFIQGAGSILKAGYVSPSTTAPIGTESRRSNSITSEPTAREPAGSGPIRIICPRLTTSPRM